MGAPVLDTHVWVWWMLGDPGLSAAERHALDSLPPDDRPILCDISLWEFATLVDLGRLAIDVPIEEWLAIAASPATVRIQPVIPAIVSEMNKLPPTFHRDPADRLIVATSRCLKTPLATSDRKIRKSRLVSLWKP
jgi:PIN domain nuclease of toxin-antitoxin system